MAVQVGADLLVLSAHRPPHAPPGALGVSIVTNVMFVPKVKVCILQMQGERAYKDIQLICVRPQALWTPPPQSYAPGVGGAGLAVVGGLFGWTVAAWVSGLTWWSVAAWVAGWGGVKLSNQASKQASKLNQQDKLQ